MGTDHETAPFAVETIRRCRRVTGRTGLPAGDPATATIRQGRVSRWRTAVNQANAQTTRQCVTRRSSTTRCRAIDGGCA